MRLEFSQNKPAVPGKESEVQKQCWSWLDGVDVHHKSGKATLQDFSFMCPNGMQIGGSHKQRARYMSSLKAQGFRPGVSDIVVAYPSLGHHGAYIELKRERRSYGGPAAIASAIRPEQRDWLRLMHSVGYYVCVAYGLQEFKDAVRFYLTGETQEVLPEYLQHAVE